MDPIVALVYVVVILIILGAVYMLVERLSIEPMIKKIIMTILIIIAILYLLRTLGVV